MLGHDASFFQLHWECGIVAKSSPFRPLQASWRKLALFNIYSFGLFINEFHFYVPLTVFIAYWTYTNDQIPYKINQPHSTLPFLYWGLYCLLPFYSPHPFSSFSCQLNPTLFHTHTHRNTLIHNIPQALSLSHQQEVKYNLSVLISLPDRRKDANVLFFLWKVCNRK